MYEHTPWKEYFPQYTKFIKVFSSSPHCNYIILNIILKEHLKKGYENNKEIKKDLIHA